MERQVGSLKAVGMLVILSVLSFNIPANAEESEEALPDAFEIFDRNGDGVITRYEGPETFKWRPGLFDLEDLDNDSKITRSEFSDWRKAPRTDELLRQTGAQN